MKYQHKLNNVVLFETDDYLEYFKYVKTLSSYERNSILLNLLEKSGGYICDMATTN